MATLTLRALANMLQLSHWTISAALRNSPLVASETKLRVRRAARSAGYRRNPLVGAVMSELRRTHRQLFRGVLGVITLEEADRPTIGNKFSDQQIQGARLRAEQLGYKLEVFTVGNSHVRLKRLESILQARGIVGLMLMPAWWSPNFRELDWSRYAGVYVDYVIIDPPLHSIYPDHYRSMMDALARLKGLGYRRPGLFLRRRHNDRLQNRWEAALLIMQHAHRGFQPVPSLLPEEVDRENFTAWFNQHKPDVVIGHQTEAMAWMRACGAKIPATHGFFCLNLAAATKVAAGLDQQPKLIGARAIDILTAQLARNELGVPQHSLLTTIPSLFVAGPTLRRPSGQVQR